MYLSTVFNRKKIILELRTSLSAGSTPTKTTKLDARCPTENPYFALNIRKE
jgi:hypothetical protein